MPSSNPCYLAEQPTPAFQVQIFRRKVPDTSTRVRQVENLFRRAIMKNATLLTCRVRTPKWKLLKNNTRHIPGIVGEKRPEPQE